MEAGRWCGGGGFLPLIKTKDLYGGNLLNLKMGHGGMLVLKRAWQIVTFKNCVNGNCVQIQDWGGFMKRI